MLCCHLQHRALVVKRLHTTVEEDASTKARLGALSAKLEAAGAEKLQLEHRLKLQRLEQAKAMGALQVCGRAVLCCGVLCCGGAREGRSAVECMHHRGVPPTCQVPICQYCSCSGVLQLQKLVLLLLSLLRAMTVPALCALCASAAVPGVHARSPLYAGVVRCSSGCVGRPTSECGSTQGCRRSGSSGAEAAGGCRLPAAAWTAVKAGAHWYGTMWVCMCVLKEP